MENTLTLLLSGFFIGAVLSVLTVFFNKTVIGPFVKRVINAKAATPEDARSMAELGYSPSVFVRIALRKRGMLRKVVFTAEDGGTPRYYIPHDKLYRAQRAYGGKDVDLLMVGVSILLLYLAAATFATYLPPLIDMFMGVFLDIF
jgi:hypothetical protein